MSATSKAGCCGCAVPACTACARPRGANITSSTVSTPHATRTDRLREPEIVMVWGPSFLIRRSPKRNSNDRQECTREQNYESSRTSLRDRDALAGLRSFEGPYELGGEKSHPLLASCQVRGNLQRILVAPQGFEPRLIGSEPTVLPLNEGAAAEKRRPGAASRAGKPARRILYRVYRRAHPRSTIPSALANAPSFSVASHSLKRTRPAARTTAML